MAYFEGMNNKPVEWSMRSLKSSRFGREFFPTFDISMMCKECSGGVETHDFGEMKGRLGHWQINDYINMTSLPSTQEDHFRCLQDVAMNFSFHCKDNSTMLWIFGKHPSQSDPPMNVGINPIFASWPQCLIICICKHTCIHISKIKVFIS